MDFFTPADTLDTNNYLRAVITPSPTGGTMGTVDFLMPVTGFENNGQPVTPAGFDKRVRALPHHRPDELGD